MILYLDTSALVKLYVDEDSSDDVARQLKKAETAATHVLAFVEARAAFARLFRDGILTDAQFDELKTAFADDWPNYVRIGTLPKIVERAANFSEAFSLRAYDSVHLAAADYLQTSTRQKVYFACFDRKLNQAAEALGMVLV